MITLAALGAAALTHWRLVAGAAALVLAAGAGWQANGWRLERQIAELEREHAALRAEASRRTAQAQATQRAIEAQRVAAIHEVNHVATLARARDEADRRASDAAHLRVLDAARAAAARAGGACQDPGPAADSSAAAGAVRALADVLGEAGAFAGELAAAVDASRTAGLACVGAYQALK